VTAATDLLASGTSLTATDRGSGCSATALSRVTMLPQ
jgi:hypothetical protein